MPTCARSAATCSAWAVTLARNIRAAIEPAVAVRIHARATTCPHTDIRAAPGPDAGIRARAAPGPHAGIRAHAAARPDAGISTRLAACPTRTVRPPAAAQARWTHVRGARRSVVSLVAACAGTSQRPHGRHEHQTKRRTHSHEQLLSEGPTVARPIVTRFWGPPRRKRLRPRQLHRQNDPSWVMPWPARSGTLSL